MRSHHAQAVHIELERVHRVTQGVESPFDDPQPDQQGNDEYFSHAAFSLAAVPGAAKWSTVLDRQTRDRANYSAGVSCYSDRHPDEETTR
jgi:hypothetical protein